LLEEIKPREQDQAVNSEAKPLIQAGVDDD